MYEKGLLISVWVKRINLVFEIYPFSFLRHHLRNEMKWLFQASIDKETVHIEG